MENEVVSRARALLGTRFRLHGRNPETGIDCVGLAALAADVKVTTPTGYALRGGSMAEYITMIDAFSERRNDRYRTGDVLLLRVAPNQFHMGIWTGESLIHAHAGLRRVVETPGIPENEIIGTWRVKKETV